MTRVDLLQFRSAEFRSTSRTWS